MELSRLLIEMPDARLLGDGGVSVSAVAFDSREVGPGCLFVAVPGLKQDGHNYLSQALDAGAAAVAVQADRQAKWAPPLSARRVPALIVPDSRAALARIAAALHGYPGRRLRVVGVTGTDGKTSLSHLIAHLLDAAGQRTGLVSTAQCRMGELPLPDTGRFTTPEAPQLQEMLGRMVDGGCRWAVVEATSHGLALHRLDGCEFDVAVVTDVGRDHLDFHGGFEEYRAAKGRLFQMLDASVAKDVVKTAVLNVDDDSFGYFRGLTQARVITYGLGAGA
ncbi:MAG TPA: Mur ligase family protein, partial [Dehalococcoidia bacterium]|nr:Mur ligase family protein [Dehalococcoidia bacterium]